MSEHLNQQRIEGYNRRLLPAAELLAASEHLEGCDDCRGLLLDLSLRASSASPANSRFSDHPDQSQLSAYISGELIADEGRQMREHLRGCEACARESEDLREFAAMLDLRKTYEPAPSAWGKLLTFLRAPGRGGRPALLTGVVALASILILALFNWQFFKPSQAPEVSKDSHTPSRDASHAPAPLLGSGPGSGSSVTPEPKAVEPATEIAMLRVPYEDVSYRGPGEAITFRIPTHASEGRITITDVRDESPSYKALLLSDDGGRIVIPQTIKPEPGKAEPGKVGRTVTVPIPVGKLKNGQVYRLMLRAVAGHGGEETVVSFAFRVRKG